MEQDGITALMQASYNGKVEVVDVLVANGANVAAKSEVSSCCWNVTGTAPCDVPHTLL
jgi:ankyrin repeat protein